MSENRTNTIAKNTALLYMRSVIVIVLSIYTSRVLLDYIGVEDFGLYNVVGGVVALFLTLKNVFAASVQRFINFEKGKGNFEKVQEIFNTSVYIHIGIAILFLIIVEVFGLYYIPNHLVVPDGRMSAALFVFHCSVIATAISIITIPYDAVIIANERMNFYAWLSIGDTILKLLFIFLLPLFPFDYLCSYAVLILLLSLGMRFISMWYTKRFPECKPLKVWKKSTVTQLTKFAGWNFFGCMASSLIEEGSNMILNLFGGVVANASRAIAYQIRNAIISLSGNIVVASQPFIVQKAASADKANFWSYIFQQSRAVFFMIALTVLPIYTYTQEILSLWLKEVPDNAETFVHAVLIYVVVMSFQKSLDLAFKSYNKMPVYQIFDTCITLLSLPLIYVVLKYDAPLYSAFLVMSFVRLVDYIVVVIIGKIQLDLPVLTFTRDVVLPTFVTIAILAVVGFLFFLLPPVSNIFVLAVLAMLNFSSGCLAVYFIILNTKEKELVNKMISKILKRK